MDYSQYIEDYQRSMIEPIKSQLSSMNEALVLLAKQFPSIDVSAMIQSITDSLRNIASSVSTVKFDFSQLRSDIVAAQKVITDSFCSVLCENPAETVIDPPKSIEDAQSTIQVVKEIVHVQNANTSNKLKTSDIIAIIGIILTLLMWAIDKATDASNSGENQTIINNYYYVVRDASDILEEINEHLEINSDDAS